MQIVIMRTMGALPVYVLLFSFVWRKKGEAGGDTARYMSVLRVLAGECGRGGATEGRARYLSKRWKHRAMQDQVCRVELLAGVQRGQKYCVFVYRRAQL